MSCPLDCGTLFPNIERGQDHYMNDCKKALQSCQYCNEAIERGELDKH